MFRQFEGKDVSQDGSRVVELHATGAEKRCPKPAQYEGKEDGLERLYLALRGHACPHLVKVESNELIGKNQDRLRLFISPVGCRVAPPTDERTMKRLTRCAASVLACAWLMLL